MLLSIYLLLAMGHNDQGSEKDSDFQYKRIQAVNIDNFPDTIEKFTEADTSLDKLKEKNRNDLARKRNDIASFIVILMLGFLFAVAINYDWEKDRAVNQIYESTELKDGEKAEQADKLNSDFFDKTLDRYLPIVTLIVGYLIKQDTGN